MEEQINYYYQGQKRLIIPRLLIIGLSFVTFSYLIASVGSTVIAKIAKALSLQELLPPALPFGIFLGLGILIFFQLIPSQIELLTIKHNSIFWKNFMGNQQKLSWDEIVAIVWKNNVIILNDKFKLNLASLPSKQTIEVTSLLLDWLPEDLLPLEIQEHLLWTGENPPIESLNNTTAIAKNHKAALTTIRWIVIILLLVISILICWVILKETNQSIGVAIFFEFLVLLLGAIIWSLTTYHAISVNDEGIVFQKGRQNKIFSWHAIETIAIEIQLNRIFIWIDNTQKISMRSNDVELVANAVFKRAIANNIPFQET